MADLPDEKGSTPLSAAFKPNADRLAKTAEIGLCRTVPEGMKPGSDTANLSVIGYDPSECYTGRSPLEAVSMGIKLGDSDITFRANLVTLAGGKMLDYSAGEITTAEARTLIEYVASRLDTPGFELYPGVSYRHCLVWANGTTELGDMTPPHDISGRVVGEYLSKSENAKELIAMMKESYDFLMEHPVNKKRIAEGKRPANSIWLWGEGKKPMLPSFYDTFGKKGAIISAVDLLKGIAKCADMEAPEVDGATGYIDTNFEGKAKAAVEALKNGCDFAYIHLEAPDECGHRNEPENKVKAIEMIDSRVLPIVLDGLSKIGEDYKIMVLPDHPTPIVTQTHASDPVPYVIYHKNNEKSGVPTVNEETAKATGVFLENGPDIMKKFLEEA